MAPSRNKRSPIAAPSADDRPLKVEMDVVNQCNIRCRMCHFGVPDYDFAFEIKPAREIAVEQFERIAEQVFPRCAHLSLSISTEPLLHSRLDELLNVVGRFDVPFVYMHTNGLLLDDVRARAIIAARVDQLSVSVDGASASTFEEIRRGGCFRTLVGNLERLQELKRELRVESPRVAFNVVLMRSNIDELAGIVELAARVGAYAVAGAHVVPLHSDLEAETLDRSPEIYSHAWENAHARASKLGVALELPPRFSAVREHDAPEAAHRDLRFLGESGERGSACRFPWHFVGIDADGNVLPCGWWHRQPPVGNLFEQDFDEIWNGAAYEALRGEHEVGALRDCCRTCPSAGMGVVSSATAFEKR